MDTYHTIKNRSPAELEVKVRGYDKPAVLKAGEKLSCYPTRIRIIGKGNSHFECREGIEE